MAAAPRPHLVVPRKPWYRRTGIRVAALLVLLAGITAAALAGLATQRRNERLALQREETQRFGALVEESLRGHGVGQPFLTSYLVLPELAQSVSQLNEGTVEQPRELLQKARGWSTQARDAAAEIGELQPNTAPLKESRNLMRRSLELYAGMADLMVTAIRTEGRAQREIAGALERQLTAASAIFDTGWGKLTNERQRLGILEPAPIPAPP